MRILNFILGFVLYVAGAAAIAGTAVGNFNFKVEPEFDFRIGYPPQWNLKDQPAAQVAGEVQWFISNDNEVINPSKKSSLQLRFIRNFPAKNDAELLEAIKKLHPEFKWKKLENPDFVVGFSSDQIFISPNRTQAFEYYFSEKNKVIQIEALRDKEADGGNTVNTILSTIRRASGKPKIISIDRTKETPEKIKVGDTACYRIAVDVLSTSYSDDSLHNIEVRGAPKHWSFKRITWNQEDTSYEVCFKVNARFGADGLIISKLGFKASDGETLPSCTDQSKNGKTELSCWDQSPIAYKNPIVDNPQPQLQAPNVKKIEVGNDGRSLQFQVASNLPLSAGEITLDGISSVATARTSFILYPDMIQGSDFRVALKPERLPAGFTRILSIMFTDEVGNLVFLRAEEGGDFYTKYVKGTPPELTKIKVVSVVGEKKMKIVFLLLTLFLTACGSQLRKPFCEEPGKEIPSEFWGTYEYVVPAESASWSGNTIIKTAIIVLDKNSVGLSLNLPGMENDTRFCKLNDRIFFEIEKPNGTYQVAEMSRFDHGIVISLLTLDLVQVQVEKFKLTYLPDAGHAINEQEPIINLPTAASFILDNSDLSSEQVLKVLKPLSYQSVLRRTEKKNVQIVRRIEINR